MSIVRLSNLRAFNCLPSGRSLLLARARFLSAGEVVICSGFRTIRFLLDSSPAPFFFDSDY